MTPQEKATYIDTFLKGLNESSFASSLAAILELRQIPSNQNKNKFKLLELELEKHNLVEFVRGRDNSTLGGQCEYLISQEGLRYVLENKSTLHLFKTENNTKMALNWVRAFNKLWTIINGPKYMTGSEFLNFAREINSSLPSYNDYIANRRESGKSTTRKDFCWDIINEMNEENKLEFFNYMIEEFEDNPPKGLDKLVALFEKEKAVIYKKETPSPKFPNEIYVDVLNTLHSCYRSAEQKPSIYKGKGEEDLRDFALALLESRYESAVASGESFNKLGKTDIILKSEDGSNLFVAECKVWHGAEQFHKTIDQLFGYLTWRDTKAALIFFIRNKNFTAILQKIKDETEKSPYYLEHIQDRQETSFAFKFKHKEDKDREVLIEIMAFSFSS